MSVVTFGFKRAFKHCAKTRGVAHSRRTMKSKAHRLYRRLVREEIKKGNYDSYFAPFATSWDVT